MATTLRTLKADLETERDALLAQTAPLHAKADAIRAQMAPLEAELRAVTREIKAIEQPKLHAVLTDLAGIARALGGKTLVNEGPAPAEPAPAPTPEPQAGEAP